MIKNDSPTRAVIRLYRSFEHDVGLPQLHYLFLQIVRWSLELSGPVYWEPRECWGHRGQNQLSVKHLGPQIPLQDRMKRLPLFIVVLRTDIARMRRLKCPVHQYRMTDLLVSRSVVNRSGIVGDAGWQLA